MSLLKKHCSPHCYMHYEHLQQTMYLMQSKNRGDVVSWGGALDIPPKKFPNKIIFLSIFRALCDKNASKLYLV